MIRKHLYQILLLTLIIALMGMLYVPIRMALFSELENIKTGVISGWERKRQLTVKYRSISPTIINSLRIRDFSLSGDENNPRIFSFSSSRVSLYYRLNLFSRGPSRIGLRRIVIKRGVLSLELPEDGGGGIDLESLSDQISRTLTDFFPSGIIELRDVEVQLTRGSDMYLWNIDQLRFSENGDIVQLTHRGSLDINGLVSTGLTLHGSFSTGLDSVNILSGFSDFSSPYVAFERLDFQLGYNEGLLKISKVNDKYPVDVTLQGDGNIWDMTFHAEDFIPSLILTPEERLYRFEELFDMNINGIFSCQFNGSGITPKLVYSMELQVSGDGERIRESLGGTSQLMVNIQGEDWDISAKEISLNSPKGLLAYEGTLNVREKNASGNLTLGNVPAVRQKALFSRWNVVLQGSPFSLISEELSLGNEELGGITVSGETDWEDKTFFANILYRGDMADNMAIDIFGQYGEDLSLQCWYQLDGLSLERALALFTDNASGAKGDFLKGGIVDSQGFGELKKGESAFRIESLQIEDPRYRIFLQGFGNEEKIIISRMEWSAEDFSGSGSMQGDISTEEKEFLTRFSLNGKNYDISMNWNSDSGRIGFTGSYGLNGNVYLGGGDTFNFRFKSEGLPLLWKGNDIQLFLDLSGYFSPDIRSLNFHNNRITLKESSALYPGSLNFSGILEGDALHLNRFDWSDDLSTLQGSGDFLLPLGKGSLFNGWITMVSDRNERYKLLFYRENGKYNGYGDMENFLMERIKAIGKSGSLTLKIQGRDFLGNPQLDGEVSGEIVGWGNLSGLISLNKEDLILSNIQGNSGSLEFSSGLLSLDREKGTLLLSLGLSGQVAKKGWHTGILFQGTSGDLLNPGSSDFSGTLKTDALVYNGETISPVLSFELKRKGDNITLMNDDARILSSFYNFSDGMIQLSSETLMPFSFYCSGILTRDYMDVTLSNIRMDLSRANPFMPVDYASQTHMVEFTQGQLKGELELTGTPKAPLLNGVFIIDPLQLNTSYSTKEKGVTRMAIDITDNTVTIPYFEFTLGQTGTIGSRGEIILEGWNPDEFHFYFSLLGHNGGAVPMIYPIKGLALNGEAQGEVSFYGTGQQYFIDGDLLLDRLVMSLAQTPQKPKVPKNERINPWDLNVDLNFTTGKAVSMVIPNEEFHVVKATVDIDQNIRYRLDNIPWVFSLTGDLSIRSGDIAYFDKTFYLTEGMVSFNESQNGFDPLLNVSAESSLTYQGEDVTLMIDYSGSLFSDFDPQFSSVPSYSERELLSLLQPYQDQEETNTAIALALGTYADKYTFSAPFEEGIKDALKVDMVTIETGFLKNIIEDQLNSGQGVYTNDSSQYNVARYLDGTYLNVGKYLGRDLFMAGGISVDYSENRTVMSGMGFKFNVKLEMETPFFNIGWSYLPDDLDNRSSSEGFISDTSITINFRL